MTPAVPKSGEQEDHIAPKVEVLIYAVTASGILGKYAATRSPFFIPIDFIHSEILETSEFKSSEQFDKKNIETSEFQSNEQVHKNNIDTKI